MARPRRPPRRAPGAAGAVRAHDDAVRALGLEVWLGGEPTFTDRASLDPAWLGGALGADKEARARALLRALRRPGDLALRSVGRQYPGEDRPRFSYGLYRRRDGGPVAPGAPADPLDDLRPGPAEAPLAAAVMADLAAALEAEGHAVRVVGPTSPGEPLPWRLAWALAPGAGAPAAADPRLRRPPLGDAALGDAGLEDPLAADGVRLLGLGDLDGGALRIEVPRLASVDEALALLGRVGDAARARGAIGVVWTGFPPPVDARVAWLSVTPDPGVVEVNMAPSPDLQGHLADLQAIHAAAAAAGLSPWRASYSGEVGDSGGGGQLTFGGPSPEESPFLRRPRLLPRLLALLNRHPALGYWFAVDNVGSSSQSPRTDEGAPELFDELGLALDLLTHGPPAAPEALWEALAPFLADRLGNGHRAEVNVEKLWSPDPTRGRAGLVELRALRMTRTPLHGAAVAALFRALIAWLGREEGPPDVALVDWGRALRDRFALPVELMADLRVVLARLEAAGLGLAPPLAALLLDDAERALGRVDDGGRTLSLRRALEFWPLVGDAHAQERGTARWVDSSTARLEVALHPAPGEGLDDLAGEAVEVRTAAGWARLPLRPASDASCLVLGLRRRTFAPRPGLHPALPPNGPLALRWRRPGGAGWRLDLHDWRPDGGAYDGLPGDLEEAARRRAERLVVAREADAGAPACGPDPAALTPWSLDLRRIAARAGRPAGTS
ncbi:MAG: transglutaminase family protein [Planctomycetes bacterium]|nr:transglutaminase family protein [Planctomycetota bacterium]